MDEKFNGIVLFFILVLMVVSLVKLDVAVIPDGTEIVINSSGENSLDVNIQDQTSKPVDFFFTQLQVPPTTVAVQAQIDDLNITVSDATGISIGDYLGTFNSDNETDNRAYFGEVIAINGNTLSLDTPLDYAFRVGDTVGAFTRNINPIGTRENPEIYSVIVGSGANQSIDITRLMISFVTDGAVDLSTFGDIAGGLEYGVVLRRVNGITHNIWNIKNNGDLANLCFDYTPYSSSNPQQGQDGAKFRCTFAGQDKHGVAIRLDAGDELQLLVQDDLTSLNQFRIIAEGHYVVD